MGLLYDWLRGLVESTHSRRNLGCWGVISIQCIESCPTHRLDFAISNSTKLTQRTFDFLRRIFAKTGILLGLEIVPKEYFIPFEVKDKEKLIVKCLPFTGIGKAGLIDNLLATEYIRKNSLAGDIVEAGIHMGGSIGLFALASDSGLSRKFWCYDTFLGMPEPSLNDSKEALDLFVKRSRGDGYSDWCDTSLEKVKENLETMGAPTEKFRFVVGKVEETLIEEANLPKSIAILRLDTDWYESTRIELEQLFPLVVAGGIVIIDDYGKWAGSRAAVDEYFSDKVKPFMYPSGPRRIFVKS